MRTFEIWMEGYSVTGGHSTHSFLGTSKGNTFREAVISFINKHPEHKDLFDEKYLTIWACRLFPTEEEAAKEEIYEDRFLLNGEEVVFNNDEKEEMFSDGDIKEAIGLGAKWAVNEFIKDLWHPASEEPREFAEVLAEAKITESIKTYISFKKNDALFKNWDAYSSGANITRWLYIDDLLPKEGGNQ